MYQFRNERGSLKIYDTRTRKLYWLSRPDHVVEIVDLLNQKAAQHGVEPTEEAVGKKSDSVEVGGSR